MNCKKLQMPCKHLTSIVLIAFVFVCSCAKQIPEIHLNLPVNKEWTAKLKKPLPAFNAWGEIIIDIDEKIYSTEFVLSVKNESLNVEFLDPTGNAWWSMNVLGDKAEVVVDGKTKKGGFKKIFKKQFGLAVDLEELKSLLYGRPFISNNGNVYVFGENLKSDDAVVYVQSNKINEWNTSIYKARVSDYRKISKIYNIPFEIDIFKHDKRVSIKIKYSQFELVK